MKKKKGKSTFFVAFLKSIMGWFLIGLVVVGALTIKYLRFHQGIFFYGPGLSSFRQSALAFSLVFICVIALYLTLSTIILYFFNREKFRNRKWSADAIYQLQLAHWSKISQFLRINRLWVVVALVGVIFLAVLIDSLKNFY